jgi:hypothetical protein
MSFLSIYLEKKKKEGEEKEERLLLCSISRANEIYSLFYDNGIGVRIDSEDKTIHKFTVNDINDVCDNIDELIVECLMRMSEQKEMLPLISDKDSITALLEEHHSDKEYLRELMNQKVALNTLYSIFADIGDYSDFNGLYWIIES